MQFKDAAYEVLKQAGEPLHYNEIAQRALEAELLKTRGQTPEATMGSRLYVDTKKPSSRFRRVGRGIFGLTEPRVGDIAYRIEVMNRQARKDLKKRIMEMPPDRFEALVGELLLALGFDEETIEVTSYTSDGGVDVRGLLRAGGVAEVNAAVQAKRWKRNVRAPIVRNLRGSLKVHEQGIIITTSDFSPGARSEVIEAAKTRIGLINGDQLLDLLIQHRIGIQEEAHTIISLDDEWWIEMSGEVSSVEISKRKDPEIDGTLSLSFPLSITAKYHGETIYAELIDKQGRIILEGVKYETPSGAGKGATGWKAVDGWMFWKYEHSISGKLRPIDDIRGRLRD